MTTTTIELQSGIRKHPAGMGQCSWCGRDAFVYVVRFPGSLDYRIPASNPHCDTNRDRFCTVRCAQAFWGR